VSVLTRRKLLEGAGAVAAGATLLRFTVPVARAAEASIFKARLREMPVLSKSRLRIPMTLSDVSLVPGERTFMWTFDGTFPGPTIRRPAGATTRVTFAHKIPNAGTLTIHNHGHHSEAIHDGQPMSQLIQYGAKRTYVYKHVEDGKPLRGSMRWYHDHSHGRTNRNLWMGLAGLFIIEDPVEKQLKLPSGRREILLVVTTRTLDDNNQLVDPFTGTTDPGADAVGTGELLLVNGVARPYRTVEPTSYRLRILNAASFSPYNVGFVKGPKITQIGNESGLFPAPAQRDRVLMGPAERCDLIVDFSQFAGQRVVLSSVPQESSAPLGSVVAPAAAANEQLIEFRVRKRLKRHTPPRKLPAKLVALPEWTSQLPAAPDRTFIFGQALAPGGQTTWTINGAPYDPEQVVARPEVGSAETWMLLNTSQQSHFIHLHAVDWKVVSRNGGTPAADEDVLKETFRLDPGETIAVGARFTDHTGRFLIHCHMLSHEDHAMMTTFEIAEPGGGDRVARRSPAAAEAVVRGRRVLVPLDTVTPEEAERARRLLAAQMRAPGVPARPPSEPLRLAPDVKLICRLDA
jgi:FtsP/CotA-like multicopper oxidase with cupredoxin domain